MIQQHTTHVNALTQAERDAWNRDFAAGRRKFWQGYSLIYCANAGERAGYYDAAEESAEVYRRMDEWIANRETLAGAW